MASPTTRSSGRLVQGIGWEGGGSGEGFASLLHLLHSSDNHSQILLLQYKHTSSQIIHLFIPWREEEKDDYLVGGGSKYMVLKFVGKLGRFQERILSRSHHGHQECLSIIIGQRWLVCSLARERLN